MQTGEVQDVLPRRQPRVQAPRVGQHPHAGQRLLRLGFSEGTLKGIEEDTQRKVDEATAAAKASPVPSLDVIDKDVWADGSTAWRN
jgi:TPP-dependent pyruvate/acetoin dehydrogenase alpha subunit